MTETLTERMLHEAAHCDLERYSARRAAIHSLVLALLLVGSILALVMGLPS